MTTEEKINKIADIMAGNNDSAFFSSSRFDKRKIQDFRELFRYGFPDQACQNFASDTVDQLYDVAVYALNNGFDSNAVNAINGLMDCALEMNGDKAAKKLDKMRERRKDVMSAVKMKKWQENRIKKHVMSYVDTSISFCDIQAEKWKEGSSTRRNFTRSKEKLEEIKRLVKEALDGNTATAASYAHKIDEKVILWRNNVVEGICTEKDIMVLDEAIEIAGEWNASVKHDKVASDKKDVYEYSGEDKMSAVINVYKVATDKIAAYRDQYDYRNSQVEEYNDRIADCDKEIERCNANINAAKAKAMTIRKEMLNGKKDEKTANIEFAPLVRTIKEEEKRIGMYQAESRKYAVQRNAKKDRLWLLKTVIDKYEENRNMPVELWDYIKKVDINTVLQVVDGVADKETAREVEDMMIDLQELDLTKLEQEKASIESVVNIREDEEEINRQYEDLYSNVNFGGQKAEEHNYISEMDDILGLTDEKMDALKDQDGKETETNENKDKKGLKSFDDVDR